MVNPTVILSEKEAREARMRSTEFKLALGSVATFDPIVAGLPIQVINGFRKAINSHKDELDALIRAYELAKDGDPSDLRQRAGNDPGLSLVVARITRGLTQKELARKLGLKEQQIQRYEADRYNSISISNFQRIASVLGVQWEMGLSNWIASGWNVAYPVTAVEVKKVVKHARENGWFEGIPSASEEDSYNYLQRYVSDHIVKYGSPTLLRTGLVAKEASNDLLLLAWKARITRRAEETILAKEIEFRPLDISWLLDLVKLSQHTNGPTLARALLLEKGIVLIAETQISGMKIDGAAFLVDGIPVIGMTLRRDTIDNFWFTLMHEVGHAILHYRTGLTVGFFDDLESTDIDQIENEANEFASNILIPEEKWKRSPARIAKSAAIVEQFAKELQIHPAIVFGRIQNERKNYATFSDKIGRGLVRKYLIP